MYIRLQFFNTFIEKIMRQTNKKKKNATSPKALAYTEEKMMSESHLHQFKLEYDIRWPTTLKLRWVPSKGYISRRCTQKISRWPSEGLIVFYSQIKIYIIRMHRPYSSFKHLHKKLQVIEETYEMCHFWLQPFLSPQLSQHSSLSHS